MDELTTPLVNRPVTEARSPDSRAAEANTAANASARPLDLPPRHTADANLIAAKSNLDPTGLNAVPAGPALAAADAHRAAAESNLATADALRAAANAHCAADAHLAAANAHCAADAHLAAINANLDPVEANLDPVHGSLDAVQANLDPVEASLAAAEANLVARGPNLVGAGATLLADGSLVAADMLPASAGAEERRRHPRAPVELLVGLKFDSVQHFLAMYAEDISESGMFLRSEHAGALRSIGEELELNFDAGNRRIVQGRGRVVRMIGPGDPSSSPGIAIEFVELDDTSRKLVEAIVRIKLASVRTG